MSTLLTVSIKVEAALRRLYGEVAAVCAEVAIEPLVVGAAARDLVLHHVYAAPIKRATADVDFAMLVADWARFEEVRKALVAQGFRETRSQHRFTSPGGIPVDIVPFGPIADAGANIAWPPSGETTMNVLGFQEAYDNADLIRIQDSPPLDIRVATPIGLALMKLIAWMDRTQDVRPRDAQDLHYSLIHYERIPEVSDALYGDPKLGDRHAWDTQLMAAELLGQRVRKIAGSSAAQKVESIFNDQRRTDELILEMSDWKELAFARSTVLLGAFVRGFRGG